MAERLTPPSGAMPASCKYLGICDGSGYYLDQNRQFIKPVPTLYGGLDHGWTQETFYSWVRMYREHWRAVSPIEPWLEIDEEF